MNYNAINWIEEHMDRFTPNEKKVARYLILNSAKALYLTEKEVEEKCGVSRAVFARFMKDLNYESFSALKRDLELSSTMYSGEEETDDKDLILNRWNVGIFIRKLCCASRDLLVESEMLFDKKQFVKFILLMSSAERIWFYGTGIFENLTPLIAEEFSRISSKFDYCSSMTKFKALVMNANEKDLFFVIDYKGDDDELFRTTKSAKIRKATVLSITRFDGSPLAAQCKASLRCCEQKNECVDLNLPVLVNVHYLLCDLFALYVKYNQNECMRFGNIDLLPAYSAGHRPALRG